MAQSSFPFENVDTTETQFSQMFRTLNAGVNGTPAGTELKVSAGTGLQVSVALGQAMVRGHYYISTAAELLTISTANATNPRIDTIVLRLDPVANSIVLAVVAGTAAASPVAPTLTQTDAGVYEFPLANVAVAAGAGTVGTITDRRVFMGKRLQSVGTSAARDVVFPAPVQGDMVWRDDLGAVETYFGLYNVSNPGGRDSTGWYTDTRQTGLVPMRPTAATAAGGSATAGALGQISFTGATSIQLDGVFNSNYRNYRLLFQFGATTGVGNQIRLRWTAAGSSNSSANYDFLDYWYNAGATSWSTDTGTGATSVQVSAQPTTSTQNMLSVDIYGPNITGRTTYTGSGGFLRYGHFVSGGINLDNVFDGLVLFPTAGSISGVIQILGYND